MHPHKKFRFKSLKELTSEIGEMGLTIPVSEETDPLKQPLLIGSKVIPNRMAIHPMEGFDGTWEGKPGDLTFRRYRRFASGGAGLIWFEATAIVKEGRGNPRQLIISRGTLNDLKRLLKDTLTVSEELYGADRKPYTVLQLTHAGRYCRPDSEFRPIIASQNIYLDGKLPDKYRLITDDEIEKMEDRLVDAAEMAGEAGFDAVDLKSCHYYLGSELLSAHTREGRYGGSFENRTRFLINSVEKIKARLSDELDIAVRLNAYDAIPYPYGWGVDREDHEKYDLAEPIALVKQLRDRGVKLLNVTLGNPYYSPHVSRPYDTGFYIPPEHPLVGVERMLRISSEIQHAVPDMAVLATGLSWLRQFGANCAAGGIRDGWFTLAGFGRQALAYPDFPKDVIHSGQMNGKKCCITCGKCIEILRFYSTAGCVVRDADVYGPIYREASKGK